MEQSQNHIPELLRFADEHPRETILLAEFASQVWENSTDTDKIDNTLIELAGNRNILEASKEGEPQFKGQLAFEFFYAIDFAKQLVNSGKNWATIFHLLWQKQHGDKSQSGIRLSNEFDNLFLIAVNNVLNINLLKLWASDFKELYQSQSHTIEDVLPYFKLDRQGLVNFLVAAKNDNVSHLYSLALATNNLSFQQPQLGLQLLDEIEKPEHEELRNITPGIIKGISRSRGIDFAMSIVFQRLKTQNEQAILITLHSLSIFDLTEQDWGKYKLDLQAEIEKCKNHESEAIRVTLLRLLTSIYRFDNSLEEYVVSLSQIKSQTYQIAITDLLWLHGNEFSTRDWYRLALLNLSTWTSDTPAIDNHISYIASTLVKKNRPLFIEYLNAWIENNENRITKIDIFRNSLVDFFVSHEEEAKNWLTLAFLSPNSRFHMALQIIISNLWVSNYRRFTLDKNVLNSCPFELIKYLLFKIMGYVYNKEALESLVFSILDREPQNEKVTTLIVNAFHEHITFNYGGSLSFLRDKKTTANDAQKTLIDTVVTAGEEYNSHLRPIWNIPELKLKETGNIDFVRVKMKRMSASMKRQTEEHRKNSITGLFKNISIKGGKGFFGKYDGNYSEPAQMGTFSSCFEMPVGEAIDPVQEKLNLIHWREYKYPL